MTFFNRCLPDMHTVFFTLTIFQEFSLQIIVIKPAMFFLIQMKRRNYMKNSSAANFKLLTAIIMISVAVLLLSGCGGGETSRDEGGGGDVSGTISGYVTQSNGGSAVSGTTLTTTAKDGGKATATTDSNGYYSISLSSGTYDVAASRSGYAASKAQNVIFDAQAGKELDLIQMPVFNNDWAVSSPTLSVSGVSANSTVSGTVNVSINASGANAIKNIFVRIGNKANNPDFSTTDGSSLSFSWNVSDMPGNPNSTYLYIVAYDVNHNRTEMTIPLTISQGSGTPPVVGPVYVLASSLTFAEDAHEMGVKRADMYKKLKIKKDPYLIEYGKGRFFDTRVAPPNATIVGIIEWEPVSGAKGYSIYRKESTGSIFYLVGDITGGDYSYFYDFAPLLTPGKTYQYSVAAFNENGEGPNVDSEEITVLEKFEVYLESPYDKEQNVSTSPTFTWTTSQAVGEVQQYYVGALGINDDYFAFEQQVENTTSVSGASLERNKLYEWDIYYAMAAADYDSVYGFYRAQSFPNLSRTSSNGGFTFTTQP